MIEHVCFSNIPGSSKNEARDRATHETLEMLSKKCYSIVVKNKYLSDGTTIDADTLNKTKEAKNEQISSSNVGHKLLQMMGWKGGGLGRGGSGISEPISAEAIFDSKRGLGASENGQKAFKHRIRTIITEYAHSNNPFDLVFTSGFDNEQRAEMHR